MPRQRRQPGMTRTARSDSVSMFPGATAAVPRGTSGRAPATGELGCRRAAMRGSGLGTMCQMVAGFGANGWRSGSRLKRGTLVTPRCACSRARRLLRTGLDPLEPRLPTLGGNATTRPEGAALGLDGPSQHSNGPRFPESISRAPRDSVRPVNLSRPPARSPRQAPRERAPSSGRSPALDRLRRTAAARTSPCGRMSAVP